MVVSVSCAVEGNLDEAVARKLLQAVGAKPGFVYGKNGKQGLLKRLAGYNNAANSTRCPWLVIVDLDNDADCAPSFLKQCKLNLSSCMCFRIAVRAVEAWLLADRQSIATFLRVPASQITPRPERDLLDPKAEMVKLASQSSDARLRAAIVPRPGSGRSIGSGYTACLIEYVHKYWRPSIAAQNADSLRRALDCIQHVISRCPCAG